LLADYCHDRFCRPCAAARSRRLADALTAHVGNRRVRLITLTLRSCRDPLKVQLKRMMLCFRNLRQRPWWQAKVTGGLACIEVTHSAETGLWHPHVHVIACGSYVPQAELSGQWLSVTGDSPVVDVRDGGDVAATCRYVSKYVSKGVPASIMGNVNLACEVVTAFTGTRGYTTFGDWHGLAVTVTDDDTLWIKIAPLDAIICASQRGDGRADALLERLRPKNFEETSTQHTTPGARGP